MKKIVILLLVSFILSLPKWAFSQNVGIGTNTPHSNAILEIKRINKGILIPRGDAATRTALNTNTAKSLLLCDTVTNTIWIHNGNALASGWQNLSSGTNYWQLAGASGTEIQNTNSGGYWSVNRITVSTDPPSFTTPISGAGTRMMWMPAKSSFRVGTVFDDASYPENESVFWDSDSIGLISFGIGLNVRATGTVSTAIRNSTSAGGYASTAIGFKNNAIGDGATAMGYNNIAFGDVSTTMGTIILRPALFQLQWEIVP